MWMLQEYYSFGMINIDATRI